MIKYLIDFFFGSKYILFHFPRSNKAKVFIVKKRGESDARFLEFVVSSLHRTIGDIGKYHMTCETPNCGIALFANMLYNSMTDVNKKYQEEVKNRTKPPETQIIVPK